MITAIAALVAIWTCVGIALGAFAMWFRTVDVVTVRVTYVASLTNTTTKNSGQERGDP